MIKWTCGGLDERITIHAFICLGVIGCRFLPDELVVSPREILQYYLLEY